VAQAAIDWIKNELGGTSLESTALALHARIQEIVDDLQLELPPAESARFFYRSDLTSLMKSPESVLDKIARTWDASAGKAPQVGFRDFKEELEDLSRFRIVLNFLVDVQKLCRKLEEPYSVAPGDVVRLTAHQQALFEDFNLRKNCFADFIMVEPGERKSGQRCHKGVFALRRDARLRVEVQIQTMLQEAWDKKDHILVYEPRRRGETIQRSHSIETYAMSEVLYVVDLTFDRLLEAIRNTRREGEGN
jgi:ppGpp synthetase/RelA/SpoT-type nucleotidyltranferase